VIFPYAIIALALLAYGSLFVFPSLVQRLATWRSWPSAGLPILAKKYGISWAPLTPPTGGSQIVEVDPTTGAITRVVAARGSRSFSSILTTPDGSGLFVWGTAGPALIDSRSGGLIAQAPLPNGAMCDQETGYITGGAGDGRFVDVNWWEYKSDAARLTRWDTRTGELRDLGSVLIAKDSSRNSPAFWGRRLQSIPGSDPIRILSTPTFMEAFQAKKYDLRILDEFGTTIADRVFSTDPGSGIDCNAAPVFDPDRGAVFLAGTFGYAVRRLNITDLSDGGELELPGRDHCWDWLAVDTAHARLLCPGHQMVHVRDMGTKEWLASLALPLGRFAPKLTFSSDGRWIAARCQVQTAKPPTAGSFAFDLVIWDLSSLQSKPTPANQNPDARGSK